MPIKLHVFCSFLVLCSFVPYLLRLALYEGVFILSLPCLYPCLVQVYPGLPRVCVRFIPRLSFGCLFWSPHFMLYSGMVVYALLTCLCFFICGLSPLLQFYFWLWWASLQHHRFAGLREILSLLPLVNRCILYYLEPLLRVIALFQVVLVYSCPSGQVLVW